MLKCWYSRTDTTSVREPFEGLHIVRSSLQGPTASISTIEETILPASASPETGSQTFAQTMSAPTPAPTPAMLRNSIIEEMLRTRGFKPDGWFRMGIEPLFSASINHF